MRSCISSSEWLRTWGLAAALTVIILGMWELTVRKCGYEPMMVDTSALWSYWRDQAVGDAIVAIGDSRTTCDLNLDAIRDMCPGQPIVQLGLQARPSPVAVLADLAADERFHGTVICGITEDSVTRENWEQQQPQVNYYRKVYNLNIKLNVLASCWFRSRLAMLSPVLVLDESVLRLIQHGRLPDREHFTMTVDRARKMRFSIAQAALIKQRRDMVEDLAVTIPSTPVCQWLADVTAMEPHVQAIQGRGGHVVFVKYPVDGRILTDSRQKYPRATYWSALAARTAATCIHFEDYPELSCFRCEDSLHLDSSDTATFTTALIHILRNKGVLAAAPEKTNARRLPVQGR